ncbi:MAG: AAA family ATPase [Candidatus Aquiluna sp. XM-24bin5]|nr:MAG: AAA family ATPase [Candidatus Aquiluna sp. XM-24bin5]
MSQQPLAERLRPKSIDDFVGQKSALVPNGPLSRLVGGQEGGSMCSVLLWGPPGSGKTTLARLISVSGRAKYVELSAIDSSVSQVREVIQEARNLRDSFERPTVLFLDEIHRFSKAQQDSLLGAVESGVITLVAATTENPSFSVIKPLISRSLVIELSPLQEEDILTILERARMEPEFKSLKVEDDALDYLAAVSQGDARRALSLFEAAASRGVKNLTLELIKETAAHAIAYDATGDQHYDTISAFIKSVRGSDVDSALHYLARMIVGGEDPRFIARRLMILASEDIGLADPQAMVVAEACASVVEKIGMPEGRIPLAETTIYLALAPKSNRAYLAIDSAIEQVRDGNFSPVPPHLRSTGAVGYVYPHDSDVGIVRQEYSDAGTYFKPSTHGFEKTLGERLEQIRKILGSSDI